MHPQTIYTKRRFLRHNRSNSGVRPSLQSTQWYCCSLLSTHKCRHHHQRKLRPRCCARYATGTEPSLPRPPRLPTCRRQQRSPPKSQRRRQQHNSDYRRRRTVVRNLARHLPLRIRPTPPPNLPRKNHQQLTTCTESQNSHGKNFNYLWKSKCYLTKMSRYINTAVLVQFSKIFLQTAELIEFD